MNMLKIAVKCIFTHKNNLAVLDSLSAPGLTEVRIQNCSGVLKPSRCRSNFSYFGVCTLLKESFDYLQCTNELKLSRCQRGDCHHPRVEGVMFIRNPEQSHQSTCPGSFMLLLHYCPNSSNQPTIQTTTWGICPKDKQDLFSILFLSIIWVLQQKGNWCSQFNCLSMREYHTHKGICKNQQSHKTSISQLRVEDKHHFCHFFICTVVVHWTIYLCAGEFSSLGMRTN